VTLTPQLKQQLEQRYQVQRGYQSELVEFEARSEIRPLHKPEEESKAELIRKMIANRARIAEIENIDRTTP